MFLHFGDQRNQKSELIMGNRAAIEPSVNIIHPPGAVVTGGPPGIRLSNPVTKAPIQGKKIWEYSR